MKIIKTSFLDRIIPSNAQVGELVLISTYNLHGPDVFGMVEKIEDGVTYVRRAHPIMEKAKNDNESIVEAYYTNLTW